MFWLTKGKLLFNTIADLFILARSIHISEKSLKSAYQIVSDFSDGKSDENLILGYDLQQFRVKYRDHNIFYPINPSKSVIDYLDELDLPTNVTYLNDILSLLFYVKSEDSSILIISENFVLKNILDRFIDKDLLPINIQFMFTYHFVLSLFTFCSLDFLQLDNFKKIYKIDYFKFNSMDYKIKTAIFESTEKNFLSLLLEKRDEMKKSIPLAHKL